MGDRALIILKDKNKYSPVCYLHWDGSEVKAFIDKLQTLMYNRKGDLDYSFARLVGICHEAIDGNLSLGVWNLPGNFEETPEYMKEFSHGDNGVYVVDCNDFSFVHYDGKD